MSSAVLSPMAGHVEASIADAATGCYSSGAPCKCYVDGQAASLAEAAAALRAERLVEVPNAGAGSYRTFFANLGFDAVKALDNGSSAGNWTFGVRDAATGHWHPAWQHNRYPRYGFSYSMEARQAFASFEEFAAFASI